MQHIRSRRSNADENTHEIYVEIVSCGSDVVKRLKDCMHSDVIVYMTSGAPVDGMTSSLADSKMFRIRHNVSLDRTDTQCTTVLVNYCTISANTL